MSNHSLDELLTKLLTKFPAVSSTAKVKAKKNMPPTDSVYADFAARCLEISKTGETNNPEGVCDKVWSELKPADFKALPDRNSLSLADGAQEHLSASNIEPNGSINFAPSVVSDGRAQCNTDASPVSALQADIADMMQDISNGDLIKLVQDLPLFVKDLLNGLTGPGDNSNAGSVTDGAGSQVPSATPNTGGHSTAAGSGGTSGGDGGSNSSGTGSDGGAGSNNGTGSGSDGGAGSNNGTGSGSDGGAGGNNGTGSGSDGGAGGSNSTGTGSDGGAGDSGSDIGSGTTGDQGIVGGDRTTPLPLTPVGDQRGNFSVSTSGFVAPNGKEWVMSGLNASVDDALNGFSNVQNDFPKLTAIRLNVNPDQDSMANIDKVVQEYTAKGIVVELEDHSGNGNNVGWYTQMAQQYKSNSLVMLETPNEPSGDAQSVASSQIQIIQAIRAAGFNNPIGIQPVGGYDQSNIDMVTNAVGKNNLFVTPHIYYSGTDPNGAMQYAQSEIEGANQKGLYAAIDEFGSAMDGWHKDPLGDSVNRAMIALNQQGHGQEQHVGAIYWGMDNGNHPDGADSAFLDKNGNQLTPEGTELQQLWLG